MIQATGNKRGVKKLWPPSRDLSTLSAAARTRREKVLVQKAEVTTRISETTRTIAFGVLATCYALFFAEATLAKLFVPLRPMLLYAAVLALLTIMVDALQYGFGYVNVQRALAHEDQGYPKDWSRRGRTICFFLKQFLAYAAGVLLVITIARALL